MISVFQTKPLTDTEFHSINGLEQENGNWLSDPILFENSNNIIAKINGILVDLGMLIVYYQKKKSLKVQNLDTMMDIDVEVQCSGNKTYNHNMMATSDDG